ncbi:MAG: paraquat-inducible protein A [Stenotrophobium sp.]
MGTSAAQGFDTLGAAAQPSSLLDPVMQSAPLVICTFCDSVYRRQALHSGEVAHCQRCGGTLYRNRRFDLDTMLALTLTSLITFFIANAYPVMRIDMNGIHSDSTLWNMIRMSYDVGVGPVALATAISVLIFPLLQICLLAYVLVPLRLGRVPLAFTLAMHTLRQMRPWSMVEVFMLGMLVSMVKLSMFSDVNLQAGFWGFVALTCLLTTLHSFDLRHLWDRAEALQS